MRKRCNRRQFLTMAGYAGVQALVKNIPIGKQLEELEAYIQEWAPAGVNLKDHTFFWDHASGYYYFSSIRFTSQEGEVSFAYARSQNLREMEDLGIVLSQRSPGWWDEACVWAPHLVKQNDTYYLFFTGVKHFFCQSILIATTTDLSRAGTWQISKDCFFQPTHEGSDWRGAGYWSDCRDPMIFQWDSQYLMYYTGRDIDGFIIGVASATDLNGPWIDLGATLKRPFAPDVGSLESPGVFHYAGSYYLFYNNTGLKKPEYRISHHPLGPWSDPIPLAPGWAHEFFSDQEGKLWCSYLTNYKITVQPVTMDHMFNPPRIFLGRLNHTFLPVLSH